MAMVPLKCRMQIIATEYNTEYLFSRQIIRIRKDHNTEIHSLSSFGLSLTQYRSYHLEVVDVLKGYFTCKIETVKVKTVLIGMSLLLVSVQYLASIYHYVKEWRRNPKWSLSSCGALLLPLDNLQEEIGGLPGRNILGQQLQAG